MLFKVNPYRIENNGNNLVKVLDVPVFLSSSFSRSGTLDWG